MTDTAVHYHAVMYYQHECHFRYIEKEHSIFGVACGVDLV